MVTKHIMDNSDHIGVDPMPSSTFMAMVGPSVTPKPQMWLGFPQRAKFKIQISAMTEMAWEIESELYGLVNTRKGL